VIQKSSAIVERAQKSPSSTGFFAATKITN